MCPPAIIIKYKNGYKVLLTKYNHFFYSKNKKLHNAVEGITSTVYVTHKHLEESKNGGKNKILETAQYILCGSIKGKKKIWSVRTYK